MLSSMTAYGRHEGSSVAGHHVWEIRSVNNRYLDMQFRLPEAMRAHEARLRELVGARLSRGRVEVSLRLVTDAAQAALSLNDALLRQLGEAVSEASRLSGMRVRTDALKLLAWPGVIRESVDERERQLVEEAMAGFAVVLDDLVATRRREGAAIAEFLAARADALRQHHAAVSRRRPLLLAEQRQRMRKRLAELLAEQGEAPVDERRLEQELVLLAQKQDVQEELDRLAAHLDELARIPERNEAVGRRLDFLMQELQREVNTIASKSNDSDTTAHCIDMKVLVEQLREQVQNVE